MSSLPHLYLHFRQKRSLNNPLYLAAVMFFFWSVFDGIVSYISPILVVERGFSNTVMGLIIGTSSLAGAVFDLFLAQIISSPHHRRLFLLLFAVCFIEPLLLWQAATVFVFLISMALWGIYYDIANFANLDFVSREIDPAAHVESFGIIDIFKSLGYLISPLIVGFIIARFSHSSSPFILMWIFLTAAFLVYLMLNRRLSRIHTPFISDILLPRRTLASQVHIWRRLVRPLLPVLSFICLINIYDAFFWTVGPLFSISLTSLKPFNGLILAAYSFPPLFINWFLGDICKKHGKKITAYWGLIVSGFLLLLLPLVTHPLLIIFLIFTASCFGSISFPAIQATFSDYVQETPQLEKDTVGLADFFGNLGYIIGPLLAGLFSDLIGYSFTFSLLGSFVIGITLILLIMTPRHIHLSRYMTSTVKSEVKTIQ